MRKIRKAIGDVLFTLVCVMSGLVLAMTIVPKLIGYTVCGMQDESMSPTYPKGALVIAEPVKFDQIHVGDVLVFTDSRSGNCFSRRVAQIWTEKKQFVTISDASDEPDPVSTAFRCVLGRIQYKIPYVGYFPIFLNSVTGKIVLLLLYVVWISIELEISRSEKRAKEKEKKA